MEKLRLKQRGLYEIEVNDNGDTIVLDTLDIELPIKIQKMFDECEKIAKEAKAQIKVIEKKPVKEYSVFDSQTIEVSKYTKKALTKMRSAIDLCLGENACNKIFGNRYYLEMFEDLQEALMPHIERAFAMNEENAENEIKEKYGDKDEDVI